MLYEVITTRNSDIAQKVILTIEGEHMKLLHRQVTEPWGNPPYHILRTLNPFCRGAKFRDQPLAQFQGGQDSGRLGRTDPRRLDEFRRRAGDQFPERALERLEQSTGHRDRVLTRLAGPEYDGQEFDRCQG